MNNSGRYWCELALIDGCVQSSVAIEIDAGRFSSVTVGVEPAGGTTRLEGFTIPGLANSHSHAFHRLLRSRTQGDRGTFWTWRDLMYLVAQRLQPDTYRRLARATFAEMVLAGVTCVGEFHYIHHQPDGTPYENANEMGEALLAAASDAGLRITLLDTLYLHDGLDGDGYRPPSPSQSRFSDQNAAAWAERVDALRTGDGQRIGAGIHSVRAVDPSSIETVSRWATHKGAPVHAHVSEQTAEDESCLAFHGRTPIGVFEGAGLLSDRFVAVHATHVTDNDIEALAVSNAQVSMCPTTERDLADGIGPTNRFSNKGVPMSLGSDSHAVIDIFEEARGLELDERLRSGQRGVHTASDLLDMATVNGHRGLGWDDAGKIRVGHRADLVTVALDSVRTAGTTSELAVETVIFSATASDVTDVLIDGRHVVADGHHKDIDVAADLDASIRELVDS